MVDVGQGDCTLVITPTGKTILVDGGGSSKESDFDVGERIVVPYLLNKGICQIDYLVFSHFDTKIIGNPIVAFISLSNTT